MLFFTGNPDEPDASTALWENKNAVPGASCGPRYGYDFHCSWCPADGPRTARSSTLRPDPPYSARACQM